MKIKTFNLPVCFINEQIQKYSENEFIPKALKSIANIHFFFLLEILLLNGSKNTCNHSQSFRYC